MNKQQIIELRHIIYDWLKYWKRRTNSFQKKRNYLKQLIEHIFDNPDWLEKEYTKLDTAIFWKINLEQKKQFFNYIDWKIIDPKIKKEIELTWKKIIILLSSIYSKTPHFNSKNIDTKIESEMKTAWQALDRFIIYAIKESWSDINLSIKKSKAEYEWKKIDFISEYKIYWTDIKISFANQLTAQYEHQKKYNDLEQLRNSIDQKENKTFNFDSYKEKNIPDIAILFSVKNWLQEITRKKDWHNSFNNSYKKIWNKNIIENVGKNKVSKEKNRILLKSIWISYPNLISHMLKNIKEININKDYSEYNKKLWRWFVDISYNSESKIYSMTFKNNQNSDETSYILDFYITDKFIDKMWIKLKK
jgi:hypothetical protein